MRHNSERVKGKNYRPLAGKQLYRHIIDALLDVPEIDEVIIDTDSDVILEDAAANYSNLTLLVRPEHLRDGMTAMNDVLINTSTQVEADVMFQTHSTNPFLSADTIRRALDSYLSTMGEFDSMFAVTRLQARLWTADMQPVNHDPKVLLRTQDLSPIYLENSCFYIFDPKILVNSGNRVGPKARFFEVPALEALDVDEESDFALAVARAAANAGMANV